MVIDQTQVEGGVVEAPTEQAPPSAESANQDASGTPVMEPKTPAEMHGMYQLDENL